MGDVVNDNELNLQILKRVDPDVEEVSAIHLSISLQELPPHFASMLAMQVLATAGHVCLYYMHVTTQQWVSSEGLRATCMGACKERTPSNWIPRRAHA
jgi:hypothetical protein